MDSTALITLFIKYSEELEEFLQCPVCLELPTSIVSMCARGHHICVDCIASSRLQECPVCKSSFNGTRNFLIQNITLKLQEMKHSLLDSMHVLSQQGLIKEKISIGTQTTDCNNSDQEPTSAIVEAKEKVKEKAKIELYTCQIRFCDQKLKYYQIIPHLRYYHNGNFIETVKSKRKIFTQCWTIEYAVNKIFDQAIYVPNLGIFFFNITIHENGQMYGNVQIANKRRSKKRFKYKINLTSGNRSLSRDGWAEPCRSLERNNLEERMSFFMPSSQISDLLKTDKMFFCTLSVARYKREDGELNCDLLSEIDTEKRSLIFKCSFDNYKKIFNSTFVKLMFFFFVYIIFSAVLRVLLLYKIVIW